MAPRSSTLRYDSNRFVSYEYETWENEALVHPVIEERGLLLNEGDDEEIERILEEIQRRTGYSLSKILYLLYGLPNLDDDPYGKRVWFQQKSLSVAKKEQGNRLLYKEASSEAAPQEDAYAKYVGNGFADLGIMDNNDGDINF
ncbi:hypothetical protein BC332_15499 [Capsicum chinense]|nr:hypothetical protein BC332_15499 [Capsicum chinense]